MQKWKRFTFFKKELKKTCTDSLRQVDITTCVGWGPESREKQTVDDPSFLVYGDSMGSLHMLDAFNSGGKRSVQAFRKGVNFTSAANEVLENGSFSRILVALGNSRDVRDEAQQAFAAKITEATALSGNAAAPPPPDLDAGAQVDSGAVQIKFFRVTAEEGLKQLSAIEIFPPKLRVADKIEDGAYVTSFDVLPDLSQIAVGLSDGKIILYRGTFEGSRKHNFDRVVIDNGHGALTGLYLHGEPGAATWQREVVLFAVTATSIKSYQNIRDRKAKPNRLSMSNLLEASVGGEAGCSCVNASGILIVCRDDGIFMYNAEDSRGCYALNGPKAGIYSYKHYACLVSIERGLHRLSVYDTNSKFVALTMTLRSGNSNRRRANRSPSSGVQGNSPVKAEYSKDLILQAMLLSDGSAMHLVSTGGIVFLTTSTRRLYSLEEKTLMEKLNALYKKHMYSIALKIAVGSGVDSRAIYMQSADHLYSKGDFDQATQQYIETIGYLESSRVIRKFLGSQHIGNLASYLEAYHKHPEADLSVNHTTLLLKCFTKMEADEKLRGFIGYDNTKASATKKGSSSSTNMDFDVGAAIDVLSTANYSAEALFLAEKHNKYKEYIQIQLEVIQDWRKALNYIGMIPVRAAGKILKLYGMLMLEKLPEETTDLLKDLCTRVLPNSQSMASEDPEEAIYCLQPEEYISVFIDHPYYLKMFLWDVVVGPAKEGRKSGSDSKFVWNTLIELCLIEDIAKRQLSRKRMVASPTAVKRKDSGLSAAGRPGADTAAKSLVREETMSLLQDPDAKYDTLHIIVKVQQAGCNEALLYLYEKKKMYGMMMQHYMDIGDNRSILRSCRKLGGRNPQIWVKVLNHFASLASPECDSYILQVLKYVSASKPLPILLVVNILSKNESLPMSIIQDYISSQLSVSIDTISELSNEKKRLKTSTAALREKIKVLKTKGKIVQNNKCDLTEHPLEAPTVHFMTGNSYSIDNVPVGPDGELECPIKGPEHRRVWETETALKNKVQNHEDFFREMSHAATTEGKGFKVVAEYFGKNLLTKKSGGRVKGRK
eukprot:g4799.t1